MEVMEQSVPPLDIYVKYQKGVYLAVWSGKINGQRLETATNQYKHYPTPREIEATRSIAVRAFWRAMAQKG